MTPGSGRLRQFVDLLRCKIHPVRFARTLGVTVGDRVTFYGATPSMFSTEPWLITIGSDVHITNGVRFLTHDGGTLIIRDAVDGFVLTGDIEVGDNTYLGTDALIMPGVRIGRDCIIGARTVVTRDVPDGSVIAGVPGRVIGTVAQYTEKVKAVMAGDNARYYSDLEFMHSLSPRRRGR